MQLANVEYLFAAAGFVVSRDIKSCKPTLTVESALRFADEQKLSDVRCFLESETRREGKARRLTSVSQRLGQELRLREREPNIAIPIRREFDERGD